MKKNSVSEIMVQSTMNCISFITNCHCIRNDFQLILVIGISKESTMTVVTDLLNSGVEIDQIMITFSKLLYQKQYTHNQERILAVTEQVKELVKAIRNSESVTSFWIGIALFFIKVKQPLICTNKALTLQLSLW
eukprot:TRINITY_DN987_c0_g1_i4.p3 TRINITY_DN987_c0_g1~~TRINITY_DN987_c0_g1_i4.p3  ORF type:complete len:134 (+),score=7.14 TRINITY_DN987_c0_g1_i4:99-500(+)